MSDGPPIDDISHAIIGWLPRLGVQQVQIRYSDEDLPVVWMAVAVTPVGMDAAAGLNPNTALRRLAEQLVDGGTCTHCHCPTMIDFDFANARTRFNIRTNPPVCWYVHDPELNTFRRSCS
jgi:hypothetical protein